MKKIKIILIAIVTLYSLYVCYTDIVDGNLYNTLITLSVFLVMAIPELLRRIFKFKISEKSENIYLIFIFISHFLGSIVNLYDTIYWYDTFVHFLSGIVCSFFILELLIRSGKYDKKSSFFNALFIIAVSFMIAGLWEDFEFISDKLFNADAQKALTTGVNDTMKDMIVASLGSLLFCITYLYRKDDKKSYINKFIEDIK